MLKVFRFGVETVLARVQRAEDHRPDDYRLSDLRAGLWQVSQALRQLAEGEFDPHRKRAHIASRMPLQRTGEQLTAPYVNEVLRGTHIPVRSTGS